MKRGYPAGGIAEHPPHSRAPRSPFSELPVIDLVIFDCDGVLVDSEHLEDEWEAGRVAFYRRPLASMSAALSGAGFVVERERFRNQAEVRRLLHGADPDNVYECEWVEPSNPLRAPVWSDPES